MRMAQRMRQHEREEASEQEGEDEEYSEEEEEALGARRASWHTRLTDISDARVLKDGMW